VCCVFVVFVCVLCLCVCAFVCVCVCVRGLCTYFVCVCCVPWSVYHWIPSANMQPANSCECGI
jgi:hypothetical protein